LPDPRTTKVWGADRREPNLLSKEAIAKESVKRRKIGHQQRGVRNWVQRAVPRQAVWAAALAVRKMSVGRGVSGQALRGVQTVRAAGEVSSVALDGEMVNSETGIAVPAAPHKVHVRVAHVADSGIVAQAGHQTALTAAGGATASREGVQIVGKEAAVGDPAVHGATAGGVRPVGAGVAAGVHVVTTRGAEMNASKLVAWARDVIEVALFETGATVATTETGVPAVPATDTPGDERARVRARATALGASTSSWTSAERASRAMTATLTSPR